MGIGGVHANAIPCLYAWDMDGMSLLAILIGWGLRFAGFMIPLVFMKKRKHSSRLHIYWSFAMSCYASSFKGRWLAYVPVKAPSNVLSDINRRSPITLKLISDTNEALCSFIIFVPWAAYL